VVAIAGGGLGDAADGGGGAGGGGGGGLAGGRGGAAGNAGGGALEYGFGVAGTAAENGFKTGRDAGTPLSGWTGRGAGQALDPAAGRIGIRGTGQVGAVSRVRGEGEDGAAAAFDARAGTDGRCTNGCRGADTTGTQTRMSAPRTTDRSGASMSGARTPARTTVPARSRQCVTQNTPVTTSPREIENGRTFAAARMA
jgi:hypothetical protein